MALRSVEAQTFRLPLSGGDVLWDEIEVRDFNSSKELLQMICDLELAKKRADKVSPSGYVFFSIAVTAGTNGTLVLLAGDPTRAHLSYIGANGSEPYLVSIGTGSPSKLIYYSAFGCDSAASEKEFISKSAALNAITEFAETGSLSNKIDWQRT